MMAGGLLRHSTYVDITTGMTTRAVLTAGGYLLQLVAVLTAVPVFRQTLGLPGCCAAVLTTLTAHCPH